MSSILSHLQSLKDNQLSELVVLVDPDKAEESSLKKLLESCVAHQMNYVLVGGSYVPQGRTGRVLRFMKEVAPELKYIIFPGHPSQISPEADALLLLSLMSGRNPDYLVGHHIQSAHTLQKSGLELFPTSYILIDGGKTTAVQYISNTQPIPPQEVGLVTATALAGQQLGMKLVYMDAGSGANQAIPEPLIEAVVKTVDVPLIIGGGMRTPEQVLTRAQAGAQWLVVGNALEKDPFLLHEMSSVLQKKMG
jgi:phosphoglycerol geranylgeranyltransferase